MMLAVLCSAVLHVKRGRLLNRPRLPRSALCILLVGLRWTGVGGQEVYLSQSVGRVVVLQQRCSPSTRPSGVSDVAVLVHRLGQSHLDRGAVHYLDARRTRRRGEQKNVAELEVSPTTARSPTFPLRVFMALTACSRCVKCTKA